MSKKVAKKDYDNREFVERLCRAHHDRVLVNMRKAGNLDDLKFTVDMCGKSETRAASEYLVPYDELPESARNSYIGLIVGFLDTLDQAGFRAVRKPDVKIVQ